MTYVTTREISETLADGSFVRHPANTALERFESWDYAVQQAMRRMGYVVVADTDESAAESPLLEAADSADLACPDCPGKAFASMQGLRLHLTRMHKAKAS